MAIASAAALLLPLLLPRLRRATPSQVEQAREPREPEQLETVH